MNKEEIDGIDKLEIDFNDIDELSLALEVSSKKSIYLLNDFSETIINLYQENKQLKLELQKANDTLDSHNEMINNLQNRIDKAIYNLEKSIESINKKLLKDKTTIEVKNGVIKNMNDYQIVRLKAIKMKCKEILNILKGENND